MGADNSPNQFAPPTNCGSVNRMRQYPKYQCMMDNFSGYTRWTVPRSFWWSVCCAVCCFACWFISWSVICSVCWSFCCSVCLFIWVHLLVVMVVVTMSNGKYWPRAQSEVLVLIDLFSTLQRQNKLSTDNDSCSSDVYKSIKWVGWGVGGGVGFGRRAHRHGQGAIICICMSPL